MHPLVRGAFASVLLALSGAGARAAALAPPPGPSPAPVVSDDPLAGLSAVCPPGTLPDREACVRLPVDDDGEGEAADAVAAAHFDPRGRWETYEQIPRRPDRLADWGAYRWPVAPRAEGGFVLSGYDLDRPDAEQRRGRGLSQVGHGGVDLAHERGTEVHVVALEHQQGDADVVFVGHLFGTSVVTRHFVREGGRLREYLVMHGHLDGTAPGVVKGQSVREGSLLGWVGDTGSPGIVHLHVEARRVRDGVDVVQLAPTRLMSGETTVVCDPRNVFPLR